MSFPRKMREDDSPKRQRRGKGWINGFLDVWIAEKLVEKYVVKVEAAAMP